MTLVDGPPVDGQLAVTGAAPGRRWLAAAATDHPPEGIGPRTVTVVAFDAHGREVSRFTLG